tara:strand:+ start:209 stop:808 length:600 start_codon:yes stop_codon:yes gene_type:complete
MTKLKPNNLDEMTRMCRELKTENAFWRCSVTVLGIIIAVLALFLIYGCNEKPAKSSPGPVPTMSVLGEGKEPQPIEPKPYPLIIITSGEKRLFAAIREVESGGDDYAVGDGGKSRGAYQIGRAYWKDAIEHGGVDWNYDLWVWVRPHSEQVMRWYWERYDARTHEEKARIHNGGPRGMEKKATIKYWQKVQREIEGGAK